MKLRVSVPADTYTFTNLSLIDVGSTSGRWTLLPRHIDCAMPLARGLVRMRSEKEQELFIGVGGGTLVKQGEQVTIVTPRAIVGHALGAIGEALAKARREQSEREREAHHALARLELELARTLVSGEEDPGGQAR